MCFFKIIIFLYYNIKECNYIQVNWTKTTFSSLCEIALHWNGGDDEAGRKCKAPPHFTAPPRPRNPHWQESAAGCDDVNTGGQGQH